MLQLDPQLKTSLFSASIVVLFIISWEFFLRNQGFTPSYDDGKEFFAHEKRKIYQPIDQTTVFIGSSRIKYDLDAQTWLEQTGEIPVQLACVGSTPIPVLNELANDEKFKGKLVIDVTEKLFFNFGPSPYRRPNEGIKYFSDESYAQKASYAIDFFLQSQFVFLDKENFTLNPLLHDVPLPPRKNVFVLPVFPREFERVNAFRQSYMTDRFAADTADARKVQEIWKLYGEMGKKKPAPSAYQIDSLLGHVKQCVDKMRNRGVQIIFTRTPSTGDEIAVEKMVFSREKYWQRLLDTCQIKGIFFSDYPELANLNCPEYSHLDLVGAKIFTKKLSALLKSDFGWTFKK